ncbi:uncharacterized protein LOC126191118 [Schistocerca cancellata]|uniref:uncharacterized protein LOC126191118 n=1 Tax=Schistocerca cancellata TaxID=274614 RepID=UPI00211791C1|nr:uncharacterized protein LOC126191118 [Schistocerca cancellata]
MGFVVEAALCVSAALSDALRPCGEGRSRALRWQAAVGFVVEAALCDSAALSDARSRVVKAAVKRCVGSDAPRPCGDGHSGALRWQVAVGFMVEAALWDSAALSDAPRACGEGRGRALRWQVAVGFVVEAALCDSAALSDAPRPCGEGRSRALRWQVAVGFVVEAALCDSAAFSNAPRPCGEGRGLALRWQVAVGFMVEAALCDSAALSDAPWPCGEGRGRALRWQRLKSDRRATGGRKPARHDAGQTAAPAPAAGLITARVCCAPSQLLPLAAPPCQTEVSAGLPQRPRPFAEDKAAGSPRGGDKPPALHKAAVPEGCPEVTAAAAAAAAAAARSEGTGRKRSGGVPRRLRTFTPNDGIKEKFTFSL